MTLQRRQFVKAAGLVAAGSAVAAPAIAQSMPEIRWRLTSSYPKSLDMIYGVADVFTRAVAEATDNRFQIQVFAAGEIVPPFSVVDAVQNATVECCHTAPYYFFGKDPTFAFACAIPFGLNARQQNSWLYQGGGNELAARLISQGLTTSLGQQVIVESRGGGNGAIAMQTVAKAPADGYTLLLFSSSLWVLPLMKDVPWDTLRSSAREAISSALRSMSRRYV